MEGKDRTDAMRDGKRVRAAALALVTGAAMIAGPGAGTAGAADWTGRVLHSTSASSADSNWTGQEREFVEITARGPIFMEDEGALTLSMERLTALDGGTAMLAPLARLDVRGGIYSLQIRHRPDQQASLADRNTRLRETQTVLTLNPQSWPVVRIQTFEGRHVANVQDSTQTSLLSERRVDLSQSRGPFQASAGFRRTRSEEAATGLLYTVREERAQGGFTPSLGKSLRASADASFSRSVSHQHQSRNDTRFVSWNSNVGWAPRGSVDISGQYGAAITSARADSMARAQRTGQQTLLGRAGWHPVVPLSFLLERQSVIPVGNGEASDLARFQTILDGDATPAVHLRAQYLHNFIIHAQDNSPADWWTVTSDMKVAPGVTARTDVWLMTGGGAPSQTREEEEIRAYPTPVVQLAAVGRVERQGQGVSGLHPSLYALRWEGQYLPLHGPRVTLLHEDRQTPGGGRRDRQMQVNMDLVGSTSSTANLSVNRTEGGGGGSAATRTTSAGMGARMRLQSNASLTASYYETWVPGRPRTRSASAGIEWRL